jgi:hypothetical protein
MLFAGARLGGCKFYRGIELCDTPGERWGHGAAMFNDNTMLIYGGYGHRYKNIYIHSMQLLLQKFR